MAKKAKASATEKQAARNRASQHRKAIEAARARQQVRHMTF